MGVGLAIRNPLDLHDGAAQAHSRQPIGQVPSSVGKVHSLGMATGPGQDSALGPSLESL